MKNNTLKYITEATFKKEFKRVDQRFEQIDQRFEKMDATIQRMAIAIVQNTVDIKEMKETMMTRADGQEIVRWMQDLSRKYDEADHARQIHLNQLMDFRPRIDDHEKRLGFLENQVRVKE